jgi:hypothetical protein
MPRFCIVLAVELQHQLESGCFSSFPPEIFMNISVHSVGPPPGQRPKILKNPFTLSHHNLCDSEQGLRRKAYSHMFTELGNLQKTIAHTAEEFRAQVFAEE